VTRLHLVRHGEAVAGFSADADPALSERGRAQAQAMAARIGAARPVVVSPLRRTRQTAAVLEQAWGVTARVDHAVGEIPSPTDDLAARGAWLLGILARQWRELPDDLQAWRDRVLAALLAIDEDSVVVTHFVAINAVVGAATDDDRVVVFRPTNCSATVVEHDGRALRVVELGAEADTVVG
jgi:broad specificity phosphatase PhoE